MTDFVTASAEAITRASADGPDASAAILDQFRARHDAFENQVLALVNRRSSSSSDSQVRNGSLSGVPFTLKDVIETHDLPTQHGSPIYEGHQPAVDAPVVQRLRAAGGVLVGKAVTAEFAIRTPRETRNPHDLERTPGGSSSGSAASVAAGFATISIGTQTTASTIRPASFCGVFGMKPTFGSICMDGVFMHSHTMDTMGIFARHGGDLARTLRVVATGRALRAMEMRAARGRILGANRERATVGLLRVPDWKGLDPRSDDVMRSAIEVLAGSFEIVEVPHPAVMDEAWEHQPLIHHTETAQNLRSEYLQHRDLLSPQLLELIEHGQAVTDTAYLYALRARSAAIASEDALFEQADVLLMPCAAGPAPMGLVRSGGAEFGRLVSALGVPSVAVPGLKVEGMPFGLQLIGPRHSDMGLVDIAVEVAALLGYDPSELPKMTPPLH